ncbi:hypothetical protein METH_02320 [Leisingera methylohalidivorans DSM 14336]|uniref:Uncharacterized protein n=1 Tax=Leisingera methylohalidivorans DSM 14336 TaxID=999552 RepID=V9VYN3_9RHOB|nr:hypothetical protein METH_02320 [Leisingera methylohalidivorans DSM 14336]
MASGTGRESNGSTADGRRLQRPETAGSGL